jgi:hypothetical protein
MKPTGSTIFFKPTKISSSEIEYKGQLVLELTGLYLSGVAQAVALV